MKRYFPKVFLLCSFILILLAPDTAWAAKFGKVTVDPIQLYNFSASESTRRGYAGYLFVAKNRDTKSHTIQIKLPSSSYSRHANYLASATRTCKLSPGQTTHLWIYQPAIETRGKDALVTVDGHAYDKKTISIEIQHESLDFNSSYRGMGMMGGPGVHAEATMEAKQSTPPVSYAEDSGPMPLVPHDSDARIATLVGRGLSGNVRDQLGGFLGRCNMIRSAQKSSQWPTNWIAYSQFDGIILADNEFNTLTPEIVNTLADYVSVGGVIWVRPNKKSQTVITPQIKKLRQAADNGLGSLLTSKKDYWKFERQATKRLRCTNTCVRSSYAARSLPAIKRNATPVRLFLVLLIFYALLIGPALQYLLKRKRRRIWMLWIIPVTSIFLCAVVFVGSYLSEGFHGFANFRNITLLDQTSGRASTIGWASFYSPLSDGAGLRFSTVTVLQPQWAHQGRRNEERHEVSIDWTSDQHLTSGWLQAKTPISFRLWKAESRREKITIRKNESGKLTATNALGADAESLKLHMADGQWYTVKELPAGETRELKRTTEPKHDATLPTVKDFCLNPSNWLLRDHKTPEKDLVHIEPGTYQVMVDGHPFVNTAITNPAKDQGKTLVFGRFIVE